MSLSDDWDNAMRKFANLIEPWFGPQPWEESWEHLVIVGIIVLSVLVGIILELFGLPGIWLTAAVFIIVPAAMFLSWLIKVIRRFTGD